MKITPYIVLFFATKTLAQFPPPAGQPGTTALHADSSVFVGWANQCRITRGYQDISDPALGYASVGDSSLAFGKAGSNAIVSLGDGGEALLQFEYPLIDGPGWDFAVFENSFSDDFLELAFVEVSSDGQNFYRFPSTSLTQDTVQKGPFDLLDATHLNNLAGKYRALYGTPFDLSELAGEPGLDVNRITHVKIMDVVGSIDNTYATRDQNNRKINDPWPTPFSSSGFDLDAVGVIHWDNSISLKESRVRQVEFYPNPAVDEIWLTKPAELQEMELRILSLKGELVYRADVSSSSKQRIDLGFAKQGLYILELRYQDVLETYKLIISRENH